MSEQEVTPTPEPTREEVLSRYADVDTGTPEPTSEPEITPEALNEKPEAPVSAAPSIREFIRAQATPTAPEPTGLELEVRELRAALDSIASNGRQEATPSREEVLLQKFEELQARQEAAEADAAKTAQQEAFDRQVSGLRAAAIENINAVAETEYPGLAALEQQETVVNALFQRLEEGQETSEAEIASEVEGGLREVYEKLHAVYGSQPSQDPAQAPATPQTLTTDLSGADNEPDLSKMTRQEKIDYLWSKSKS